MRNIIPGCLHPSNGPNSIDWNDQGFIAHASHNSILVIDAVELRQVQVLAHHETAINIVRWAPKPAPLKEGARNCTLIASTDISGHVIISDFIENRKINDFSHGNSQILQMCWYLWKDMSRDFLLCLHSTNTLILWNVTTSEKVWTHSYQLDLLDFTIDPFTFSTVIFSTRSKHLQVNKDISINEPKSSGDVLCLDETPYLLNYHKAYRNLCLAAVNNQMYMINPELMCILSKVVIESNIICWLSMSRRDALFLIHSNGAVTLRTGLADESLIAMEKINQTECIKHGANQKIIAASMCPITQSTACVLYQNGRMNFWQLKNESTNLKYRSTFIEDYLSFTNDLRTLPISDLSIHQYATINSLSAGVTCVRMRPHVDNPNDDPFADTFYSTKNLAAVGTNSGTVHLVDIHDFSIFRDLCVQVSPIKYLEWGGAYSIVTAGFNHSLSTSQVVRNDVFITDIRTGLGKRIRPEADESPISIIRVSHYHCYLAIAFQREPLEIWDLKGLRMLRRMTKSCPLIIDMAWSNKHNSIRTMESMQKQIYKENLVLLDSDNCIYNITLRGLHVKDGKVVNTQWKSASAQICALAWKDDILAVGDVEGSLVVWDLGRKNCRRERDVPHARVLQMMFSRLAGDHTMAILYSKCVTIWDTDGMSKFQTIRTDASAVLIDVDFFGVTPLLLSNDNKLRMIGEQQNSSISLPEILDENRMREKFEKQQLEVKKNEETPMIQNELLFRKYIGDTFAIDLLSIALDRLSPSENHLAPNLQLFWKNEDFKQRESHIVCIACSTNSAIESKLVEQAIVVGGMAKEKATDRLIMSPDMKYSSIKAALLASSQDDDKTKSLIKLIASNLIASDLVDDGIQLLFLVGAGNDACKYLQSQKLWTRSIIYAKMGLSDPSEIESKWIAHLSDDSKHTSILAGAARLDWPSVVEATSSFDPQLARLILRTTTATPPLTP